MVSSRTQEFEDAISANYQRALKAETRVEELEAALEEAHEKIDYAIGQAIDGGFCDGSHHKQWTLDQVLRALFAKGEYEKWRKIIAGEPEYYSEWDEGIA